MARRDKEGSWEEGINVEPAAEAGREGQPPRTTTEALSDLSEGLNSLIRNQFLLARVELKQEFKSLVRDTIMQMAGVPFVLIGYLFLMLAAVAAIALALPIWASLLIVAGVHVLAGIGVILFGVYQMRRVRIGLPRTADEFRKSRSLAQSLGKGEQVPSDPDQLN